VEVTRAYVGLGSNLGDREATIRQAVEQIAAASGVTVVAMSSLRDTEPMGYVDQPRFLNGAAAVETDLSAPDLLRLLLEIEAGLGRIRSGPRFGPRTIDLDLLLYGNEVVDEPGLSVPHPRLHERRFVLEPLAELEPTLEVPGRGPVEALLARLDS
jgi:2-amino-4-hydroxy-6-hydroxymethyldihydropteridine diphosphokinase